jgi:hypothetical protein
MVTNNSINLQINGKNPYTPAFQAYIAANQSNVTGDGTTYHIPFDSLTFDQTSNFTTGSSAVFTAPVTGYYYLAYTVAVSGLTVSMTDFLLQIVTTANTNQQVVRLSPFTIYNSSATIFTGSRLCNMSAGDTAYLVLTISGGTKVVTVLGTANAGCFFSGFLAC